MATACVSRSFSTQFGILDTPPRPVNTGHVRDFQQLQKPRGMKGIESTVEGGLYGSAITNIPLNITEPWLYRDYAESSRPKSSALHKPHVDGEFDVESENNGQQQYGRFDPTFDADLASLISRLNENVVIKDRAVVAPLSVQVPRGYLMEEAISPAEFYRSRQNVKSHLKKRKRTSSALSKKLRRGSLQEPHGFRPQEVNRTGAVSLEDCRPSTLSNEIHPLFDRSCFDDVPDAIYDQFIPGLQLATMFLTQPICMQFWVTLAMGERVVDLEMSENNGKASKRIGKHVDLTQQRADSIIKRIKDLGNSKLIHFRFRHKLAGTRSRTGAWGLSDPICDYRGIQKDAHGKKDSGIIRSIIRLHADYYIVAKKLSQLKYPEVSQKLRFNFLFANLIMHELAHSIEGIHIQQRADQWVDWQTSRFYKEPYWLDWQSVEHASELGRAWEETMFGGEIAPINNRVDGSHGVGTCDWPPRGSFDDPERRVWHTVSMDYIEGMFQMETWQQNFDLKQWRIFNIPRDGATSLYLNYFTTMSQDEEQRIANEEIADLMELEIQQPAKKKRVIASGEVEDHRLAGEEVIEQIVEDQAQQSDEPVNTRRQVPMFSGTRRLSVVMSGPLPDDESRIMLTPQSRKPSSRPVKQRRWTKVLKLIAKKGYITHDITPLQRKFIEDQRQKDKYHRLNVISATKAPPNSKAKAPISQIVRRARARPIGLMDRYRQRRKNKIMDKRAKQTRKVDQSAIQASMLTHELVKEGKHEKIRHFDVTEAVQETSTESTK